MNRYWENGSGCYDPTAKQAIDNEGSRNKQIHDTIREVKNIFKSRNIKLVERMIVEDMENGKIYK